KASKKYSQEVEGGYDLSYIMENIDQAASFYNVAIKRDEAMLKNTLKQMKERDQQVAALITGGFHTKGLTELMKSKGLSYLVVVPKYEDQKERPYIAILTGKTEAYEELIEKGQYELAVAQYFSTGQVNDLAYAIALAVKETGEKDLEATIELYQSSYEGAQAGLKESKVTGKRLTLDEFRLIAKQFTSMVQEEFKKTRDERFTKTRAVDTIIKVRTDEIGLEKSRGRINEEEYASQMEELDAFKRLVKGEEADEVKKPRKPSPMYRTPGLEEAPRKITPGKSVENYIRDLVAKFFPRGTRVPEIQIDRELLDGNRYCEYSDDDEIIYISPAAYDPETKRIKDEVKYFDLPHEVFHAVLSEKEGAEGNAEEIAATLLALLSIFTDPKSIKAARENDRLQYFFAGYGLDIRGTLTEQFEKAGLGMIEDYRDILSMINAHSLDVVIAQRLSGENAQFAGLQDNATRQAAVREALRLINTQKRVLNPLRQLERTGTEKQKFLSRPYFYVKRLGEIRRILGQDAEMKDLLR
ncbi:MAG: hypothetical protein WBC99_05550, partial [Candidatus Omnitrophota bacterium]